MSAVLNEYLRHVLLSVGLVAGVAALGAVPTIRLAGGEPGPTLIAMAVGCLVSLAAGALGAWPIAHAGSAPEAKLRAAMSSIGARMGGVMVLGLLAVLSGRLARGTLLAWIGLSYAVGLAVEVRYAGRVLRRAPATGAAQS